MRVAGIDVSSRAIDIVTVPLDGDYNGREVEWTRISLEELGTDAITRASNAAGEIPRGTFWDTICHVAIERPYGRGIHSVMTQHLVIGAIIGALPERLRPPRLIAPQSWRKQAGMKHDASKDDVRRSVIALVQGMRRDLPQDVYDALSIARAGRALWTVEQSKQLEIREGIA